MDFTLALTHFCEAHGPKSVLCSQVLPLECSLCLPPSPALRASSSIESLSTEVHEPSLESSQSIHVPPTLRKTDTNSTLPTDFSGASTTVDSETEPDSPTIEKHPLFQSVDQKQASAAQWRYGRNQGDTCASCTFSVPKDVAEKLPNGAPGSRKADGTTNTSTGAPVLRSREFVCLREKKRRTSSHAPHEPSSYGSSVASSAISQTSSRPQSHHSEDCHDHTLTYLSAKSPVDPENYAQLRASVIRTLSCELLPRGMSDGPLCFGDSNIGYTIAYVFRLTDPKARGRRRAYAFVALAGKDASRAFQACPMLWKLFKRMAKGIETAAQRNQEKHRQKDVIDAADASKAGARNCTPVSSFLTSRSMDQDGHPRRAGQSVPRSLAEIVGDENIFTFLHQYFVAILRSLGEQFGGTPLVGQSSVYQSISEDAPHFNKVEAVRDRKNKNTSAAGNADVQHLESLRDDDATPKPQQYKMGPSKTWPLREEQLRDDAITFHDEEDDIDLAKAMTSKTLGEKDKNKAVKGNTLTFRKSNAQCAVPLAVSETAQRQVVV